MHETVGPVNDLWIGTYPEPGAGPRPDGSPAEGIWHGRFDPASGQIRDTRLVLRLAAPSFLAFGDQPDLIYAVDELDEGKVSVCRIVGGGPGAGPELVLLTQVPSGGSDPCHLFVQPGLGIIVANYAAGAAGAVSLIRLGADGLPEPGAPHQVIRLDGSGPVAGRQTASHAHFILPMRGCADEVLVSDLGADQIRRYLVDRPARRLVDAGVAVALPSGTGPRHAVFSDDGRWLYVVGELDGQIHRIRWDADTGTGRWVDAVPVSGPRGGSAGGPAPAPAPSHLTLSGATLTVGVRGTDLMSLHQVGADGSLGRGRAWPLPGACPRHHAAIGPWLVVAQQDGGGLVSFDEAGSAVETVPVPAPACVLPQCA